MTTVLQRPIASVHGRDQQVTCADGRTTRSIDLDYAASAPALDAVVERVREVLPHCASVHRGAGHKSQVCTREYESARNTVHRFCGADPDDVVVFTRNTTDALNLLAGCVPGTRWCWTSSITRICCRGGTAGWCDRRTRSRRL